MTPRRRRLLGVLFADKMTKEEKIEILEREYQIPMDEKLEKELEIMCNLGQGVLERGLKRGIEQGIEQGIELGKIQFIISMHDEGYAIDKIAKVAKMNQTSVKKIIKENANK